LSFRSKEESIGAPSGSLRDRRERVVQINEVRSRLEQAFRYLSGLCVPRYESERAKKERDQRMRNS
jgi:hypothetical protein